MEISPDNRREQSSLIKELTQGMELAKQLRDNIGSEFSAEGIKTLLQQILSSYDKALLILGSGGGQPIEQPIQLVPVASPSPVIPSPSVSFNGSDDFNVGSNSPNHQDGKDALKKRKTATVRNEQVRLNPDEGIEGPPNDGYNWRKYGQKDILGARYPRSYYRCTYQNVQGCRAKRQVQKSDEDPALFNISYQGTHTCTLSRRSRSAPTSPPGQQQQQQQQQLGETQPNEVPNLGNQYDPTLLMKFQTGLNVTTPQDIDNNHIAAFPTALDGLTTTTPILNNSNDFYGSCSPSFISPSTPGLNYLSTSPYNHQMDTSEPVQYQYHHNPEQDVNNNIISAAASATNSPTIEPNFLFEWSFNPGEGFPFSDPRFWQ